MSLECGYKIIGLNVQYGSLEDPRTDGNIFLIKDMDDNVIGQSKKNVKILGPSFLILDNTLKRYDFVVSYLITHSPIIFDVDQTDHHSKKIGVIKKNLTDNQQLFYNRYHNIGVGGTYKSVCFVEDGSQLKYCDQLDILGPSIVVYGNGNKHPLGGKVWIETNSEVEMMGERN